MKILSVLILFAQGLVACAQATNQPKSSLPSIPQTIESGPPSCDCCVFDEIKSTPGHQIKLANDTATGQRTIIRGTVYQSDGKTPAANVLMYFYQTDHAGRYSKHGNE